MKRIPGLLLFVALLATIALAQGSGSSGGVASARGERPFAVTKTVTGKVTAIKAAEGMIVIEDAKGRKYEVKVDRKTKFSADAKSELGEKKDLTLSDFQTGQTVRLVFREMDKTATMLQLRGAKA